MGCSERELADLLPALLEGGLGAELEKRCRVHLAACQSCQEDERWLRVTASRLRYALRSSSLHPAEVRPTRLARQAPEEGTPARALAAAMCPSSEALLVAAEATPGSETLGHGTLREHLATCSSCSEIFDLLQASILEIEVKPAVPGLPPPMPPRVQEAFRDACSSTAASSDSKPPSSRRPSPGQAWRRALALAASLGLVISLANYSMRKAPELAPLPTSQVALPPAPPEDALASSGGGGDERRLRLSARAGEASEKKAASNLAPGSRPASKLAQVPAAISASAVPPGGGRAGALPVAPRASASTLEREPRPSSDRPTLVPQPVDGESREEQARGLASGAAGQPTAQSTEAGPPKSSRPSEVGSGAVAGGRGAHTQDQEGPVLDVKAKALPGGGQGSTSRGVPSPLLVVTASRSVGEAVSAPAVTPTKAEQEEVHPTSSAATRNGEAVRKSNPVSLMRASPGQAGRVTAEPGSAEREAHPGSSPRAERDNRPLEAPPPVLSAVQRLLSPDEAKRLKEVAGRVLGHEPLRIEATFRGDGADFVLWLTKPVDAGIRAQLKSALATSLGLDPGECSVRCTW